MSEEVQRLKYGRAKPSLLNPKDDVLRSLVEKQPRLVDAVNVFAQKFSAIAGNRNLVLSLLTDLMWTILVIIWETEGLFVWKKREERNNEMWKREAEEAKKTIDLIRRNHILETMMLKEKLKSALAVDPSQHSSKSRLPVFTEVLSDLCYIESFVPTSNLASVPPLSFEPLIRVKDVLSLVKYNDDDYSGVPVTDESISVESLTRTVTDLQDWKEHALIELEQRDLEISRLTAELLTKQQQTSLKSQSDSFARPPSPEDASLLVNQISSGLGIEIAGLKEELEISSKEIERLKLSEKSLISQIQEISMEEHVLDQEVTQEPQVSYQPSSSKKPKGFKQSVDQVVDDGNSSKISSQLQEEEAMPPTRYVLTCSLPIHFFDIEMTRNLEISSGDIDQVILEEVKQEKEITNSKQPVSTVEISMFSSCVFVIDAYKVPPVNSIVVGTDDSLVLFSGSVEEKKSTSNVFIEFDVNTSVPPLAYLPNLCLITGNICTVLEISKPDVNSVIEQLTLDLSEKTVECDKLHAEISSMNSKLAQVEVIQAKKAEEVLAIPNSPTPSSVKESPTTLFVSRKLDETSSLLSAEKEDHAKTRAELNSCRLSLAELRQKLTDFQNRILTTTGISEGSLHEMLESAGLLKFISSGTTTVFDRLYRDAIRRMEKMKDLRDKIKQKRDKELLYVFNSVSGPATDDSGDDNHPSTTPQHQVVQLPDFFKEGKSGSIITTPNNDQYVTTTRNSSPTSFNNTFSSYAGGISVMAREQQQLQGPFLFPPLLPSSKYHRSTAPPPRTAPMIHLSRSPSPSSDDMIMNRLKTTPVWSGSPGRGGRVGLGARLWWRNIIDKRRRQKKMINEVTGHAYRSVIDFPGVFPLRRLFAKTPPKTSEFMRAPRRPL